MTRASALLVPALALLAAAAGLAAAVRAPSDRVAEPPPVRAMARSADTVPDLAWLSIAATEANPFRRDRRRAAVGYDVRRPEAEVAEPAEAPPPPPTPRPDWVLTAILWGAAPVAVFEGIDGQSGGRLVEPGARVGDVSIRLIAPDSVVVAHADTSWTFTLVEPWKRGGAR